MYQQLEAGERQCMFCGTALANRGEAYYDHLQANADCKGAWGDWQDNLGTDRPGGA